MNEVHHAPSAAGTRARFERSLRELLPDPASNILAGVSGGCDSIVLAWLLRTAAGTRTRLVLGHVNHGLRPEAHDEEAFAGELAARWGLPFLSARVDAAAAARSRGWSAEQAARVLRMQALEQLCRQAGCAVLALGHHMDDQAETLLLRMLRGTGPRGLGGMEAAVWLPPPSGMTPRTPGEEASRIRLIRPLLGFRRSEIRLLAAQEGLPWREDPSNQDRRFLRNRVRHELLPHLAESYNPRIVESLAELARWQQIESEPIARAAAEARKRCAAAAGALPELLEQPAGAASIILDARSLAREPAAVASRVMWLVYQELAGPEGVLAGRHVVELLDLARRAGAGLSGEVHLPDRLRARLCRGYLVFERHPARGEAAAGGPGIAAKNPLDGPDAAT
ncbi:MAG: tRNA lysidine(34) synthetase TilS [Candidatus Eisenbacteria bacterium]